MLTGEEFYHLTKVLRAKIGEEHILCVNDGNDYLSRLISITKEEAIFKIENVVKNTAENPYRVTLYQAVIKGERMENTVQKAVELGVSEIVPFENAYSNAKADAKKVERFRKIVLEAAKQCGRSLLPQVRETTQFKKILEELSLYDAVVYCNEYEKEKNFLPALHSREICRMEKIAVVIGSEGGFSPEEEATLRSKQNVLSVSLGKRILRADTAVTVALGVLDAYFDGEIAQ